MCLHVCFLQTPSCFPKYISSSWTHKEGLSSCQRNVDVACATTSWPTFIWNRCVPLCFFSPSEHRMHLKIKQLFRAELQNRSSYGPGSWGTTWRIATRRPGTAKLDSFLSTSWALLFVFESFQIWIYLFHINLDAIGILLDHLKLLIFGYFWHATMKMS